MINKIFRWKVTVKGDLQSNFVFHDLNELGDWLKHDIPLLEEEYGDLTYTITTLPELKIGDECYVMGDGDDKYKIIELIRYSPNRYGFILDSGFAEEVAKCYKT